MAEEARRADPAQVDQDISSREAPSGRADVTGLLIKIAVIAAVAAVAVVAAFIVTAKVLKPMMATTPHSDKVPAEASQQENRTRGGAVEKDRAGGSLLFEVDQIIVNPASTLGSRFLSCSVALELDSQDDLRIFESREVKIRDALITILSTRTVDELADAGMREPLRRQILARVNKLTAPARAKAVYFKDFVLQ